MTPIGIAVFSESASREMECPRPRVLSFKEFYNQQKTRVDMTSLSLQMKNQHMHDNWSEQIPTSAVQQHKHHQNKEYGVSKREHSDVQSLNVKNGMAPRHNCCFQRRDVLTWPIDSPFVSWPSGLASEVSSLGCFVLHNRDIIEGFKRLKCQCFLFRQQER